MPDGKVVEKLTVGTLFALSMMGCASKKSLVECNKAVTSESHPLPDPLRRAHAHNDYRHQAPLFDALEHGFTSLEADVYLEEGELRVAHLFTGTKPGVTLEKLYLEPLSNLINQNKGQVYTQSKQPLLLLIDVKSNGNKTFKAIEKALKKYKDILTVFRDGEIQESAVTILISGNQPDKETFRAQNIHYAACDGRLSDIKKKTSSSYMPMISANWNKHFSWRGEGEMPEDEREKLQNIIKLVHENGQQIRFWATPDKKPKQREAVWAELLKQNADYINTDHLQELQNWLVKNDGMVPVKLLDKKNTYVAVSP